MVDFTKQQALLTLVISCVPAVGALYVMHDDVSDNQEDIVAINNKISEQDLLITNADKAMAVMLERQNTAQDYWLAFERTLKDNTDALHQVNLTLREKVTKFETSLDSVTERVTKLENAR